MEDRDSDQLLVERVQRGDKKAFGLLVVRYERKLLRLVMRYVRDNAEAEDVVQESFIKAYRALASFRGECAFYTWLYRIGVNTAKNYLVARRHRPISASMLPMDEDGVVAMDEGRNDDTPERLLMTRQIGETVNRVMDELPVELKTAISLREIEGLTYEQIAEVMECPVGTVRSRIFRAREAIAKQLRPLLDVAVDKRW